jgi:hypothetical protein
VAGRSQLLGSSKLFRSNNLSAVGTANWPNERTQSGHGLTHHLPEHCETGVAAARRDRAEAGQTVHLCSRPGPLRSWKSLFSS